MDKFVELQTVKDELITVNLNKVLFISKTKRGVSVVFDDGFSVDLNMDYESVSQILENREKGD